jgi:serine/threonine-protein kinase
MLIKKGFIHRDIKAQNIMQAEDKTIRVVDFGIARVLDTGTMTKPGTVMGSVYIFLRTGRR